MFTTVKNSPSGEKKIIFFVAFFLFLSFVFLSYEEQRQISPTGKNSWWAIYFENPKSKDLTFTIKNNGKAKKFHWKVIVENENKLLGESEISVPTGKAGTIPLSISDIKKGERVVLEVFDENGEKKEIYKLFN
jgi:hypothetical protein